MLNNYDSLFGDFSIQELKDYFSLLKEEIIIKNNFNFNIKEKDFDIFHKIMKNYGFEIVYNLNYISIKRTLKYKIENNNIDNTTCKNYFLNQFTILFIYLYYNKNNNNGPFKDDENNKAIKGFIKIYNNIYIILLKYYSSFKEKNSNLKFNTNDITEIMRLNIILSLKDLINKNHVFIITIEYLTRFFIENKDDIKELKPFKLILNLIYTNLLNDKKNLIYFKRDKNKENYVLLKMINITSSSVCDEELKALIFKLLDLIYNKNYSNVLTNNILNYIKECFYELKKNYEQKKIIERIKYLERQTEFINYIFTNEENEKKDEYMPSNCFVLDGSQESGINYNPNMVLIKKNFTLVFSFKIFETKDNIIYPIITFIEENEKKDIIFNLSICNNKLYLVCQKDTKMNYIDDISNNISYLIIVEFSKSMGILKDKIKINLNGNKKEINSCNINYKSKSSLKIGYISEESIYNNSLFKNISHFYGIIGPIIFFNNILDEKDFATNILKLKGRYDSILFLNDDNNYIYYFYYEEYKLYYDTEFMIAQNYFIRLSKKIDEECLFSICPLSMINSINKKSNYYIEDIYKKNNKDKINNKEIFPSFSILPSKKNSTYAKKNRKTISFFVEFEGISIYNLIIEFFYNLLRMILNEPNEEKTTIANEINNALCPMFNSITKILIFFKIDSFNNEFDTLGFSLKKLFSLLVEIRPLNYKLIETLMLCIQKLLEYQKKTDVDTSGKVILNFVNRLFILICSPNYFNMCNYTNVRKVFKLFNLILQDNSQLINKEVLDCLLSFSFVLNPTTFDKYNNKSPGYTFQKNVEYKEMKKEYKNLIINFLQRCDDYLLYIKYIDIASRKNISILEQYNLIKIFYENHDMETIYDINEAEKKEIESSHSFFSLFKKDKNNDKINNYNEEGLLNEYKKSLSKLIILSSAIEQRDEKYYELLKSIFILLIYEHYSIIQSKLSNKDNLNLLSNKKDLRSSLNNSLSLSLKKVTFFSSDALYYLKDRKTKNFLSMNSSILNLSPTTTSIKNLKEDENDNSDYEYRLELSEDNNSEVSEYYKNSSNNINDHEIYSLDFLLNSSNYSLYIIKAIFTCLCEQWNKRDKIKFIKSNDEIYDTFDLCFGEFNPIKKRLFSQYLSLIECITDESNLEKSLKFIFSFMKQSITKYISNQNNSFSKSIFLHLFESKSILNKFFDFCINNEIIMKKDFKDYIISSIKDINNKILSYHPRPFIFSFIKKYSKNVNPQTIGIIQNICDFIKESLQFEFAVELNINNYLYYNQIRFIKTLINIFEKNPISSQNLLINENYKLFFSIQNLINEFSKDKIIYDTRIYTFNANSFNKANKINEKKELKILQSQETKVLSNQIIFLNLFELSLLSSFLIWTSTKSKEANGEKYAIEYISKLKNEMSYNNHFISYYFDLLNNFFHYHKKTKDIPDNIKKMINGEINYIYRHYLINNPQVKETRIMSVSLFLIIFKYQSLLINHENQQNGSNSRKELVKSTFEPLVSLAQNDVMSITLSISKIKEDKKFEIILDKEESKSKAFKDYYKNYYKYLLDIILKNKNFNFELVKNDIENKFIKDENEKNRLTISFLSNISSTFENNGSFSVQKNTEKKDKARKESFGYYNEEIIEEKKDEKKTNTNPNKIDDNNKNNKNIRKKTQIDLPSLDFENAQYPILCTKRDIILTKFGYFYYKDYFKDNRFIKLKKLFFYKNNPEDENNGYNGSVKLMKNIFPCTVKNFSNHSSYYPRIFLRPYTGFFENKYLKVSHNYLKEEIYNKEDEAEEEKIFHLEYGHGLLNQPDFNLFKPNDNINLNYSVIMNESISSNKSDNSGEKLEDSNNANELELCHTLKIHNNDNNNQNKHSNKHLERFMSIKDDNSRFMSIKDDNSSSKRKKIHKRSSRQNLTINQNKNNKLNVFYTSSNNLRNNNKKLLLFECELISPKSSSYGVLFINEKYIIFQVDPKFEPKKYEEEEKYLFSSSTEDLKQTEKQIIIPYNLIFQILCRKFLYFNQAFEIFLYNGKSYYFNLFNEAKRKDFIKIIKGKLSKIEKLDKYEIIEEPMEYFNKNKFQNSWMEGKKSTLDYLLLINKFSNRSYNVLSQYLIIPWILTDFNDIYKEENYRNMSFPISAQNQNAVESIIANYNIQPENEYRYHFPMLYSTFMYVNNYLLRLYPYINNQIRCQGGKFEEPSRQFDSIQDICQIFKENYQTTMELIPEFYYIPELFLNLNYCFYGKTFLNRNRILVNNINFGKGFKSILELIDFHQYNLNSYIFSSQINKWIDNIFGENQISDKKNVINSFPRECYEKYIKEEIEQKLKELEEQKERIKHLRKLSSISVTLDYLSKNNITKNSDIRPASRKQIMNDIKSLLTKTYFYGQCPSQLFNKSHPCLNKKVDSKICNMSNIDNLEIILKNDFIQFKEKDLLYMKESSDGSLFFILLENQIIVFNKSFKQMNNLSIDSLPKIHPPFSFSYNNNVKNTLKLQFMYKYLIFEILKCKYFFVAGFLDNSFRIYSKEKDKNNMYSIYTESKVTCLKNVENTNIFFTGHQNGKIIKWSYSQVNRESSKKDNSQNVMHVYKIGSIYGHQSFIRIIEVSEKFNFIISAGDDGLIFIRKFYNFELLSYIKLNKKKKQAIDINLYKQIILLTVFKIKKKKINIYAYSLNGIKLEKITEQIKLPISLIQGTNEIFAFGYFNMYFFKISLKEKTSLICISNSLNSNYSDGEKDDYDEENNDLFKEDLTNSVPISYFYDIKNRVLFCLFVNGRLHRVNLVRNM